MASHIQNVQKIIPLDLQKTRFRIERLQKNTKTRDADKFRKIRTHCVETKLKSMKIGPGAQPKTMLKNRCQQIQKISKNDSRMGPTK